MRSLRKTLAVVIATCTLASCTTVSVTSSYDHTAAFGTYKTYSMAPGPGDVTLPVYTEMTLRNTLRSELAKRGLDEVKGSDADLAIAWHVRRQSRTSAQEKA